MAASGSHPSPTQAENILLLGPRGVGKTTWVNAALNYCKYVSLEEALRASGVAYATPSIFRTRAIEGASSMPVRVSIGSDNNRAGDEPDDACERLEATVTQSWTQRTTVHCFKLGGSMIRFIDTPGVGNPGNADIDDDLFLDIMHAVGQYDKLHGIVFFVEPTWTELRSRIDLHSILSHLHVNVVDNIVFGFTKTSNTNCLSGRALFPLKLWLNEYTNSGLDLAAARTFCFDSEGFRYLVAHKQGHELGGRPDVAYSWEHSSAEMRRMIDYFASVRPHQLAETADLTFTRRVLPVLARAVAENRAGVRAGLVHLEDIKKEFLEQQEAVKKLEQSLMVRKVLLMPDMLRSPRVVCKNYDCVDFVEDGTGEGTFVSKYKSHCHDPCFDMEDVQMDVVGHPGLLNCQAFKQGESCVKCGHHWAEHMLVFSEFVETTTEVVDLDVQTQLDLGKRRLKMQEEAIEKLEHTYQEWLEEDNTMGAVELTLRSFLGHHSFLTGSLEDTQVQEVLPKYPVSMTFTRVMSMSPRAGHEGYMSPVRRHWGDADSGSKMEILLASLLKLRHSGPKLSGQLQEASETPNAACEKIHVIR